MSAIFNNLNMYGMWLSQFSFCLPFEGCLGIFFFMHCLAIIIQTTKSFFPIIWGRLHEPKENYVGSGTWISFLHSFLPSNMPSLRPLACISRRITSIHVFFSLPCALLTCPNLIRSTRRTGASVGHRIWLNHRRFSLIISSIGATPSLVRIYLFLTFSLFVLPHIQWSMHISAILIFWAWYLL